MSPKIMLSVNPTEFTLFAKASVEKWATRVTNYEDLLAKVTKECEVFGLIEVVLLSTEGEILDESPFSQEPIILLFDTPTDYSLYFH